MAAIMQLLDLVRRDPLPRPWAEGDNIPWHDPDFSARMLREHLSQEHDHASRRAPTIDRHVAWIHTALLGQRPGRVLDLGCGPGLYSSRLARLGHACTGIDYSPASIAFARQEADRDNLACTYTLADFRAAAYGEGYDLALLIFGEFNVFRPADAQLLLDKCWASLDPGGLLLLEPHTFAAVEQIGCRPATWYSSPADLFSPAPHLVLMEAAWDAAAQTAAQRYYVVDAASGAVERYAQTMQAYREDQYRRLLAGHGFDPVDVFPGLAPDHPDLAPGLCALVAHKPALS
jgi:SAM-dependent methyltransferase